MAEGGREGDFWMTVRGKAERRPSIAVGALRAGLLFATAAAAVAIFIAPVPQPQDAAFVSKALLDRTTVGAIAADLSGRGIQRPIVRQPVMARP